MMPVNPCINDSQNHTAITLTQIPGLGPIHIVVLPLRKGPLLNKVGVVGSGCINWVYPYYLGVFHIRALRKFTGYLFRVEPGGKFNLINPG